MQADHHSSHHPPPTNIAADPGRELARLVRFWRQRLDPASISEPSGTRRRARVSQEDMGRLIGATSHWYGTLERGEHSVNYSDDFLDRVAHALRLSPTERRALYLYAVQREPLPQPTHTEVRINDVAQRLLDEQPWPAYISDEAWDIVAYNDRLARWFPWITRENNIMRWVFTYPEARHQLHDWETTWAPLMLAQMRMASAANPDNTRLTTLIGEIIAANPFARELWETQPDVYDHPDGDRRQLSLPPDSKIHTVEIVALGLMRLPNTRLIMLVPVAP